MFTSSWVDVRACFVLFPGLFYLYSLICSHNITQKRGEAWSRGSGHSGTFCEL